MFGRKKRTVPQPDRKLEPAPKASRVKASLLSLEARLMFDAAATATAAEVNQEQVAQEQAEAAVSSEGGGGEPTAAETESQDLLQALASYSPGESTTEVVFVDPTVPNYQELLNGMDPNVEVVVLDGTRDGMEQIAESLAGRTGIDAIHLISHGDPGQLNLGTGTLTQASMAGEYAEELAMIKQSLSEAADILVYGCEFAEGQAGQDAATLLSQLTGADVAASTDATGYAEFGGDWVLETQTGTIETTLAVTDDVQANWKGLLAETWMNASTGAVIAGPAGNDWYVGDSANNTPTAAGGGADIMYGAGGDDSMQGGSGNDILVGGTGNDTIYGNSDDDVILGGTGNDYLDGGSAVGKNTIIGGGGNDQMVGGSGTDVFRFTGAQSGDAYTVDGGGATDIIDLSEFSTATITNSGGVITVDRGGGNVFTITHSNVESIITAATVGNHGPLAEAGSDQTVAMSATVTLTAAGSSDRDGNSLTYQWTQIEGPKVTLSSSTAASPTFTAPSSATTLQFVVVVSDGTTSHADTVTINVGAANVAPTISNLSGDSLSYTEGAGAVVIDQGANALVADSDSANFDTGTLTVSIPTGAEPTEDVLGIRNQGTGAGQIGVSGSNVTYGGVTIGTFAGGAGGNNLVITLNSNATPTAVTALAKNITYEDINTDSPAPGGFTIRFVLTDGDGGTSANYDVSAWITAVNDAPTDLSLTTNSVTENATNGTVVGTVTATDPDVGDTKTYSLTDTAGGRFAINSSTGQITVANGSLLNYESATSHTITVRVTDGGGLTYDETFTINLTNVNEAPVLADTALSLTVAEDAGAPSGAVGSLISAFTGGITEPDGGSTKGIAITGTNETNGTWYYTTNGGSTWTAVGSVSNTSALLLADNGSTRLYFAPSADYNGTVSNGITFRAWDQTSGSNGTKVSLTTSNTVLDSMGSASFSNNNGTTNWSSGWSENDASGSGASSGSIDVSSGYMRFRPTTVGNFIAREVDLSNATSATFSFSMPATFLSTGQILVQVSSDGGASYTTLETLTSASATGTHSYDISAYVASNTQVRFYASATDSSGIRIDDVQVQYNTIGGGSSAYSTTTDTVAVTVTAVNDGPSFTSLNGTPTFTEGGSAVVLDSNVTITDTELTAANNFNGATLTLSRNGGANSQDVFSGSGTLSLSGGNVVIGGTTIGTYTNSGGTLAMTFNSSATNTLVNSAMQQIAYSNSSDAPPSSVQVNWTFSDANSGSQGSEGALSATGSVTVAITAVNDAPTDLALSANTVAENAANGTVVGTISGTDPDSGDTKTYSFTDSAGGRFAINSSTGQITVANSSLLNYESATSHSVTVRVTDAGGLTYDETFTISLTNVNETPTDLSLSANTVVENAANGTVVGTVSGTDPDSGDTKTYGFTDSAGGRFAINSSTGQITVANSSLLNYESATSHSVTVRVTDAGGLTYDETFTINLTNVNETPTDLSLSANTVVENASNGTVVGTVSGTDPDSGDTKSYTFTDSASGRFAINSSTGQITVANSSLLNYESATSHSVTVRVTDAGGLTYDETFTINLTNVNETPTGADTTVTLTEDTSHALTAANFGFSDVDAGDSLSAVRIDTIPTAGTLTLSGVAITAGHVVSVADITAGNLVFTPAGDANGTGYAALTFSVRDSHNAYDAAPNTLTFDVTAVNDAPVNVVPGAQTVAVDTPLAISGLSITDVDGNLTTVQLSVTNGTLAVTLSGAATVTSGGIGTSTLTLSGTQADINATLSSVSYQGNSLFTGADTLTVLSTDGNGATDTDTVAITVSNNAPTNVLPGPQTVAEDTPLAISGLSVTDADNNLTSVQLSVSHGTLALTLSGGAMINAGSTGSGSVTVSGTQAELNATLASLIYQGQSNYTGADTLTITSIDSTGTSDTDSVSITVTPVNDAPTDLGISSSIVAEHATNGTTVGSVTPTDPDSGETFIYQLTDTAGGRFAINAATGEITVADGSLLHYEDATSHTVTVRVTDSGGLTYDKTFTINLTDVNEAPEDLVLSSNTVVENAANGTVIGTVTGTDFDTGDSLTYSFTDSAGGRFAINSSTGQVTVADGSLLNYESATNHSVTVRVTDSGGLTYDETFTINLTNVNETPTDLSLSANTVVENASNGTVIGTVSSTDPDSGDTKTYSFTDSAGGRFAINSSTGQITVADGSLLNYESATSHTVTVRVTDAGGLTYDETFTINLTNVNETPTDLSLSANTVAENAANGTVVGTVSGTDPDSGDTKTYSFTDSAGGRFAINSSTGQITVANSSLLNYESATNHSVTVRVTDSGGLTYDETFTINLTNVNEAPTGADATVTISEDTSHALTTTNFGFSDVDAGDSLSAVRIDTVPSAGTLTLSGVNVTAGQVISAADITAGNLVFTPAADANGTGYTSFTFSVRDSGGTYDSGPNALTVDVTAVNDAPVVTPVAPDVMFVEGGMPQVIDATGTITDVDSTNFDTGVMTISITQNGSSDDRLVVGNFGTGPGQAGTTGNTVTYEGVAVGSFTGGSSGSDPLVITFNTSATPAAVQEIYRSIQFNNVSESPSTSTRQVTFSLTDGDGGTATPQAKLVSVQASNDAPTDLTLSANTVAENAANGTVIGTVSGTDPDSGDTKTYTFTDSAGGRFAINSSTGVITVADGSLLNYEGATNHSVTVRVTDSGGLTYDETFTINLTDVNEAPTDLSLSANTVVENATNGTVVGTVSTTDQDTGDSHTYQLTDNAGGRFSINSATGVITVADGTLLDYETATSHTLTVRTTDAGGLTYDRTFTINLTNVNEAPTLSTNTGSTVAEEGTDTITASELAVTDVDNSAAQLTYSIGTGPANGRLELTTAPGLSATTFTQADIAANRLIYVHDGSETTSDSFTFTVSDGAGGSLGATTVTLTITPVNDAPTITSNGGGSAAAINVAENVSAVTVVAGADPDLPSQALTYSLSGGADEALFTINASTGALSFSAPPDFEVATDANGDHVYVVQVQVLDSQGASTTQTIQITVTDVTEVSTKQVKEVMLLPSLLPMPPSSIKEGSVSSAQNEDEEINASRIISSPGDRPAPPVSIPVSASNVGGVPPAIPVEGVRPINIENLSRPDSFRNEAVLPRWDDSASASPFTIMPVESEQPMDSKPPEEEVSLSEILIAKLDAMTESLEDAIGVEQEQEKIVARVAALSGTTLSVGFVAWAIRSSALLASCLTTLPAWRSFDPLPVVRLSKRERARRRHTTDAIQRQEQNEFGGLEKFF